MNNNNDESKVSKTYYHVGIMLMSRCQGWKRKGRTVRNPQSRNFRRDLQLKGLVETTSETVHENNKHFLNGYQNAEVITTR